MMIVWIEVMKFIAVQDNVHLICFLAILLVNVLILRKFAMVNEIVLMALMRAHSVVSDGKKIY